MSFLKVCANLSFLFTESSSNILERYSLAKRAGFNYVESGFPFGHSLEEVVRAKTEAGVNQILINVFTGDVSKKELGFAAIPGEEENFKQSLLKTIEYAKALSCTKIHVMSGCVTDVTSAHDAVYERNLRYAAEVFQNENIIGLIEPINTYSVPNYYMSNFDKGLNIVKSINSPNLKLMLDLFHVQQIKGDLTHTIRNSLPYVGHIQVAQVPNRNEPDTPGEINYHYIFNLLQEECYDGFIGLEYKALNDTVKGLKWIEEYGLKLS